MRWVERICKFFLGLLVAPMAAVVLLQVFTRYILKIPLFWTEELGRYLMIWAGMIGAALGINYGIHASIQLLVGRFPRRIQTMTLWDGGKRGLITKALAIKVPDDLKGKKVRCMEDPVMFSTFKACGGIPTPLPWGEVYTSLQQGTVDVVETCIQMMELNKFHEVGKFVSFTDHYWTPAPHIINTKFMNSLSKEHQNIIWKASEVGRDVCRRDIMPGGAHADDQCLKNMAKAGATIVPIDYEVWRKKLLPTYETFYKQFGKDLIDKIMKTP